MLGKCRYATAVAVLVGLSGCGGDPTPAVAPVRGQVLYNGRPVPNAQVTFHPIGETTRGAVRPVGKVDDQGRFTLTSYKEGDGAPPGEYRVTVVWYLAQRARPGSEDTVSANYLPAKYASADTSLLTATVTPGNNDLRPFELK